MDGGWGQGGHWLGMGLHGLFWFLLIGVIAITVIWAARATNRPDNQTANGGPSPREILDARYARGEIERDDYLVRKRNLGGPEK
jgi:putative membrane protein